MTLANDAYVTAQKEHLAECEQDLDELQSILEQRPWGRLERAAAERTLQVLIESCVGIAKHWAKKITGDVSSEPRKAIEALQDRGVIDSSIPWRKVIGLRNVLVHDYLDTDVEILESLIRNEYYRPLLDFARKGLRTLLEG